MSRVTAETITDEQIRELAAFFRPSSTEAIDCHVAEFGSGGARQEARARCAALYNRGPEYPPRVGAAFAAVKGWTVQDFIDLALAAADQAGASLDDQERIAQILNTRSAK